MFKNDIDTLINTHRSLDNNAKNKISNNLAPKLCDRANTRQLKTNEFSTTNTDHGINTYVNSPNGIISTNNTNPSKRFKLNTPTDNGSSSKYNINNMNNDTSSKFYGAYDIY